MKPINTSKTTLTILLLTQLLPILAQQNTFDLEINYNQTFEGFSKKVKEKLHKNSKKEHAKLEVNQETLYFFNKKARQVKPFSEFRQTYQKAQNLTLKEDEMNNITVFFPLKISQENLNKVKKLKEQTQDEEEKKSVAKIEEYFRYVIFCQTGLFNLYKQLNEVKKHLQPPKNQEKEDDKLLQHELKVYTEFFKTAFLPGVNEIEGRWEDYKEFIKKEINNRMENKETSFRKEVQKKIKEVAKKTMQEQKKEVNKQQSQLTRSEVNKKIKELKSKKDDKKNDPRIKQKLLEKKTK